jgi:hypothetical protein
MNFQGDLTINPTELELLISSIVGLHYASDIPLTKSLRFFSSAKVHQFMDMVNPILLKQEDGN